MHLRKLFVASSFALVAGAAYSVELVTNGDFEADPPESGWGLGGITWVGDWSGFVPMPTNSAWLGGYTDADDNLTQDIDFGAVGGGTATLNFDLGVDVVDFEGFDFLTVMLGGDLLLERDLGDDDDEFFDGPNLMSFDVSSYLGTGVRTLEFRVTTDESLSSSAFIDNVSIQASVVPEPATLAVLGLGAAAAIRRRRK